MYRIFLDRPMPDLDEAEFHVSRAIKMKDRPMFFQRTAMDISIRLVDSQAVAEHWLAAKHLEELTQHSAE
uniref:Uncharacterized protein n=1 Tax=Ditylenchus dipsaci TaxID=166011 RepID=A0A915EBF4_9BILA